MPEVQFTRAGDGPVLLCLHGIGSSSRSFAAQLDGLASVATVVAWDAPGYRGSPPWTSPRGMDGYADEAVEVLDRLHCDSVDVLGTSFGGVIATRMALRHPDRVRSVVLADSTPGSGVTVAGADAMRRRADELAEVGPQAFAAARAQRLVSPNADRAMVELVATTMAEAIRLPGYAHAAEAMAETDHRRDLERVSVPALVVVGEHDRVTPPSTSREIARCLPNARYAEVPDAGHVSNVENPDAFNELVQDFLLELSHHNPVVSERTPDGR